MAKTALSKIKRSFFWIRAHKLVSLVLMVILLILGFFVYQRVTLELNKRAFAQARTAIDAVYEDIVENVGQPDNFKATNECSRSHIAIGDGPLSCYIDNEFIYGVEDKNEANSLRQKIKSTISNHSDVLKPTPQTTSSIDITPSGSTETNIFVDHYDSAGLLCAIKYVFEIPREIALELKRGSNKKPFFVVISCSGDAREIFYPLSN